MPSSHSLRRLARLTTKVREDLKRGGMGVTFRYLFRSTSILARVVELLSDHVARQAEEIERLEARETRLDAMEKRLGDLQVELSERLRALENPGRIEADH